MFLLKLSIFSIQYEERYEMNYIPYMNALAQVLINKKKKMKIPTCPKTLSTQISCFSPQKEGSHSASSSFNVKQR